MKNEQLETWKTLITQDTKHTLYDWLDVEYRDLIWEKAGSWSSMDEVDGRDLDIDGFSDSLAQDRYEETLEEMYKGEILEHIPEKETQYFIELCQEIIEGGE